MVMSDPIADMLTRIRNANTVYREVVEVPASKIKREILRIFKEAGYVKDFEFIDDGKQGILRIYLKYGPGKQRVIQGIKRISKPGLRVYAKKDELPKVLSGLGLAVISTPQGVMSDKEAREKGLGGEVLCYVW